MFLLKASISGFLFSLTKHSPVGMLKGPWKDHSTLEKMFQSWIIVKTPEKLTNWTYQSHKMQLITHCCKVCNAMQCLHPPETNGFDFAPDSDAWHKRHCSDGHQKPPSSVCHGRMKACPATRTRQASDSSPNTVFKEKLLWDDETISAIPADPSKPCLSNAGMSAIPIICLKHLKKVT